MTQKYAYRGYEVELRETGEACVALFSTDPSERKVMVTATVTEGVEVLRARVRLLIDFEFERTQDPSGV